MRLHSFPECTGRHLTGAGAGTIFFVLSGFVLTYNYFDTFGAATKGEIATMSAA